MYLAYRPVQNPWLAQLAQFLFLSGWQVEEPVQMLQVLAQLRLIQLLEVQKSDQSSQRLNLSTHGAA